MGSARAGCIGPPADGRAEADRGRPETDGAGPGCTHTRVLEAGAGASPLLPKDGSIVWSAAKGSDRACPKQASKQAERHASVDGRLRGDCCEDASVSMTRRGRERLPVPGRQGVGGVQYSTVLAEGHRCPAQHGRGGTTSSRQGHMGPARASHEACMFAPVACLPASPSLSRLCLPDGGS